MAIGALILVGLAVVFALIVFWVLRKGRRLPGDHVFRASRLSRGNRIFPTQVVITPTSVTLGKSCPLAIIWVPTSTSSSFAANLARSAPIAPRLRIVSRSTRPTRAAGKSARTSASTRSVPNPSCSR